MKTASGIQSPTLPGFKPYAQSANSQEHGDSLHEYVDRFLRHIRPGAEPAERLCYLFWSTSGLDEAIRREHYEEVLQIADHTLGYAVVLAYTLLSIPRYQVALGSYGVEDLDSLIFWKYPGFCRYCRPQYPPCICSRGMREKGAGSKKSWLLWWKRDLPVTKFEQVKREMPRTFKEWRELFRRIYDNRGLPLASVGEHLQSEVNQVAGSFLDLTSASDKDFSTPVLALAVQAADVVAWCFALINKVDFLIKRGDQARERLHNFS